MKCVYLLATLDTKGREIGYVRDLLADVGVETVIMDTGCVGEPPSEIADISREAVFEAAGTSLREMKEQGDRGEAVTRAAEGAAILIRLAFDEGKVSGVLAIGGSAGTTIGTTAMQTLPFGIPKVMVSTLASGNVRQFVGDKDIIMVNSVVDILGLNRISRAILAEAAWAMAGMVKFSRDVTTHDDKPLIAATMFGVTTGCVEHAKKIMEEAGYEVLVFHATGTGGEAMESLIREGAIVGVLDITTTEIADEVVGGVLSAGPDRLTAAAACGIPQVVSVGATDMVNFHGMKTVPTQFANRNLYAHNANVTLMRTMPEECELIGREIGGKVARSAGNAVIILPGRGVSAIDHTGQPFDDPSARKALFEGIRETSGDVEVLELDAHLNNKRFAETAAKTLIDMIKS